MELGGGVHDGFELADGSGSVSTRTAGVVGRDASTELVAV